MKRLLFIFLIITTLIVAGCASTGNATKVNNNVKATIFKSPSCGCCVGYGQELKSHGFEVKIVPTENMDAIKNKYNIPIDKQSCHTTIIGDYFIEGHVPFEAVEKLLNEKPAIQGIALPRMPSGSPGMPGPKRGPYNIEQLSNKVWSEYMRI